MKRNRSKRPNYKARLVILLAAFVVVFFASFALGRYPVAVSDLIKMLCNAISGGLQGFLSRFLPQVQLPVFGTVWEKAAETVVFQNRLPRVLAAALIGAALSLAGVSYQGMFSNPMVSPDLLGASSGAGFGAALAILLGLGKVGTSSLAFVFGLSSVLLAYVFSKASPTNQTTAMILSGMMISSLFSSGTSFIKLVADTDEVLPAITYWLMGSLTSIRMRDLGFAIVPMVAGMVPLFLVRWRMNLLTVGDEEARAMGINTSAMRLVVIVCATLLTTASVAISGMIGWVGLVIPHFCRMLFGYDYRRLIPSTALFGATFLMVVDNVARFANTSEIPLGILTSFIGAPVFVYLILTGGGHKHEH